MLENSNLEIPIIIMLGIIVGIILWLFISLGADTGTQLRRDFSEKLPSEEFEEACDQAHEDGMVMVYLDTDNLQDMLIELSAGGKTEFLVSGDRPWSAHEIASPFRLRDRSKGKSSKWLDVAEWLGPGDVVFVTCRQKEPYLSSWLWDPETCLTLGIVRYEGGSVEFEQEE